MGLLRPDCAQDDAKPNTLPRLAVERPGHTTSAAWLASQEEGLSQQNNDNVYNDSPSAGFGHPRSYRNSAIWTSTDSSLTDDQFSEIQNQGEQQRQSLFNQEYNNLAQKYGLHILLFDEDDGGQDCFIFDTPTGDRRGWFSRTFGNLPTAAAPRRSSRQSIGSRSDKSSRHKRDGSDPAIQSYSSKKDTADKLKNETLQTLVRICGKSFLYLPTEYATRSLMLPTCLRAAAQYLVQNGPDARGVFRISGSMRVVNELYDYYCADLEYGRDIAATVRPPNLPFHIKVGVHDVATLFKRLLAGLPGGILGQVSLFNALAEIQKTFVNRHDHNVEQEQALSRLLALAIGSVPSIYQRELICAVFGLLNLIGHKSEMSSSLDGESALLPSSERMGYGALGIVFGPLLLGDLLESAGSERTDRSLGRSSMSASATAPSSPESTSPRFKANRRPKSMVPALPMALDKILLANDIAETVISHWRDVVLQMRAMGVMRKESQLHNSQQEPQVAPRSLRPCRSDTFTGNDEVILPPQTPVFHGAQLRKARSAFIEHSSHTTVPVAISSLGQGTQRPADMTFKEFAARKRLKSQASSMSVAEETTVSAATKAQESAAFPHFTRPQAAISDKAKNNVSQPLPVKHKKSRRFSGTFSPLGDSLAFFRTDAQNVEAQDLSRRGDISATASQANGTSTSPWKVDLRPVRPVSIDQKTNGNRTKTASPLKYTLQSSEETISNRPNEVPSSKTAALISRIINPRNQSVNQGNLADTQPKIVGFDQNSPFHHGPPNYSPDGRQRAGEHCSESRYDKYRCMMGSATSGTVLPEAPSPTPKRHWRSKSTKSAAEDSGINGPPPTPSYKATQPGTRTVVDGRIQTPLSEIKNDARGVGKTRPKTMTTYTTPMSTGTLDKKMSGNLPGTMSTTECKETKPLAVGSTVKAMAALFDNTARTDSPATPPVKQTQTTDWSQENYRAVSPHTPLRHRRMADAEEEAEVNTATKKQSQLHLPRSEGRNCENRRLGRLTALDGKDLIRSADRSAAVGRGTAGADATPETLPGESRSTGLVRENSRRGLVRERRTEDSKVSLIAEHYTRGLKMQELKRALQEKTAECRTWRDRAEGAERRVAELEAALAGNRDG